MRPQTQIAAGSRRFAGLHEHGRFAHVVLLVSVSGPDFASLCGIELVNQSAGPMGVQGAALVLDKVLGKVLPRWPSQLSLFGLAGAAMIVAAGARGTLHPSALLVNQTSDC